MTKRAKDINQIAATIVEKIANPTTEEAPAKNPAAVALGRLGGLKGGPARAKKLSRARRRAISLKAIHARWSKQKKSQD